jgi:hypothetical protein
MAIAIAPPRATTDPCPSTETRPRLADLFRSARQEVVLMRSRPPMPGDLRHEADTLAELLRRWVRVHVLWDERLLADPAVDDVVRWQRRTRAEVRTAARVPATLALVDCRTALISPQAGEIRVCRCPETVTMVHYLVQGVWDVAAPTDTDSAAAADPGKDVLRLLADGLTDQQIARQLGVSERTEHDRTRGPQQVRGGRACGPAGTAPGGRQADREPCALSSVSSVGGSVGWVCRTFGRG